MATKQQLITQGYEWVEAHRNELLELYIQGLLNLKTTDYYRKLPPSFLSKVVASNLDGLRKRLLVGGTFDHEGVKANLVRSIKQGISLTDLIRGTQTIEQVFLVKAQQDLAVDQPQVYEALVIRINYISNLMKATMAAAAIEVDTAPASNPDADLAPTHFETLAANNKDPLEVRPVIEKLQPKPKPKPKPKDKCDDGPS